MNNRNMKVLILFCSGLLIMGFVLDSPQHIFPGLIQIIKSPDILLTDYLEVGGIGATFLNASLMGFINIWILHKLKAEFNGFAIAAVFTVVGFSFIGKNLFNFWPIYLGGYLYARFKRADMKDFIIVLMFSTTLAPVVSELTFGSQLPVPLGFFVGVFLGMVIGFVVVPVSATMYHTHGGYSLYNVGLSGGLIGTVLFSILRSFNIIVDVQDIISTKYHTELFWLLLFLCGSLIIYGFIAFKTKISDYISFLKQTGLEPLQFSDEIYKGSIYINIGIVGLIGLTYSLLVGTTLNGPIIAGIFTMMGFGAYGKHPLNIIPILVGVYFASSIKIWDEGATNVIIASLFGTTLAPISGVFGPIAGFVAGFLHLSTTMNVGVIHGGTNLYNNGFAGGFVSILMVSVLVDAKSRKKMTTEVEDYLEEQNHPID